MATLTSTGINFSDGSALNSAAPANGAVGSIKYGLYIVTSPTPGNGTWGLIDYGPGTTIGGGSLACDFYVSTSANAQKGYTNPGQISRSIGGARAAQSFPGSGVVYPPNGYGGGSLFGGATSFGTTGATVTYSTQSGSWRAMNAFTNAAFWDGTYGNSISWYGTFWIRYA